MDYDLGRAHGRVVITADTSSATRAMGDYERATDSATDAAKEQTIVERELTERRRAATEAAQRRKDSEVEYKRVMADSTSTVEEQVQAEQNRNKARGEHLQATRRATDAERAYQAEIAGNTDAVDRFVRSLGRASGAQDHHTRKMKEMRLEAERLGRTMSGLSGTITSVFATLAKGIAVAGAAGAAGGLVGLLGAGGTGGLVSLLSGAVAILGQFSGALLLLPGVIGGAVASIAALKLGLQGVGDALKNMDDPAKFAEAIQKLSPAAREFALQVYQFRDAFRGFQQVIQDGLFQPLIAEVEPLIRTLLPVLMTGLRDVANAFGQIGAGFAQWLRMPETVSAISKFLENVASALRQVQPGLQAFGDAFRTLGVVGSEFLPVLAQAFNDIATSFRDWVNEINRSGQLQNWIQRGIDAFGQLWHIIRDVGTAFANIFAIQGDNSGALAFLERISAQFRAWTESVEGNKAISNFFKLINEATDALLPVLKTVGGALATLAGQLTRLGIETAPGLDAFFKGVGDALKILGDALISAGPSLNNLLSVLGDALVQLVAAVGPSLPGLFQNLAEVLKDLAPILATVVGAVAEFLSKLTPGELEIILGIAVAFGAIGSAITTLAPIITGAITLWGALSTIGAALAGVITAISAPVWLVIAAIAALVVAGVLVYKNWDTIKQWGQNLWNWMKEFAAWLGGWFVDRWNDLTGAISGAWNSVTEFVSNAINNVRTMFENLINNALTWGYNLITNFANGILNNVPFLSDVLNALGIEVGDNLQTNSPAKKGPLHDVSPNQMGENLSKNYAAGIDSGRPAVEASTASVGGAAVQGFSSAGVSGRSGQGAPQSGFSQWADSLAEDLGMWSRFFQHSMDLALDITDMVGQTLKVVASLWNEGDNPLTRPGGIFSDQPTANGLPGQREIPGVPSVAGPQVQGEAPLPELTPKHYLPDGGAGANLPQQQNVPGVPSVPPPRPQGSVQGQAAPAAPTAVPGQPFTVRQGPEGSYGLPHGTDTGGYGTGTAETFPAWVMALGNQFDLGPSTYAGHQEDAPQGVTSGNLKVAPNPQGLNRGIDWAAPMTPEGIAKMQAFADWAAQNPQLFEQVIWRNPNTGQTLEIGEGRLWPGLYGEGTLADHENHVHTRQSREIIIDALNQQQTEGDRQRQRRGGAGFNFQPQGPTNTAQAVIPSGPLTPITQLRVQGLGPGAAPYSGTPANVANTTVTGIQSAIIAEGRRRGFSDDQILGALTIAEQESATGQNAVFNTSGGNATVGGVGGVFQQAPGAGWGTQAQVTDPGYSITRFYDVYEANLRANPSMSPLQAAIITQNPSFYTAARSFPYEEHTLNALNSRNVAAGRQMLGSPQVAPASRETPLAPPTQTTSASPGDVPEDDWMSLPVGWNPNDPIPLEVRRQHNIPDNFPDMYYSMPPGTVANVPTPAGQGDLGYRRDVVSRPYPGVIDDQGRYTGVHVTPAGPIGQTTTGAGGGLAGGSPFDQAMNVIGQVGSIAGQAFQVFNDVIENIGATANLTETFVRGVENTEDIYQMIDDIQTFIKTAADVAGLVSSSLGLAGSIVGAGAGGDPSGGAAGAAAALQAASAVAGLIQAGLETTHAAIDLGQEAYRILSKYGAIFAGQILGGPETGPLGGNVRMLLNTNTGEIYTYSEENALNKNTKNLPSWFAKAYGGNTEQQPVNQTQVNLYTGPGSDPKSLLSDTMWLANYGGAPVVSVAGAE